MNAKIRVVCEHEQPHRDFECMLNELKGEHEVYASLKQEDDCFTVKRENGAVQGAVLLGHSPICPVRVLSQAGGAVEPELRTKVAVVVLIECAAFGKRVLLTRRAALKIFPDFWVLPGGHAEPGESLVQTALREVKEETGISLNASDLALHCVWESTYPINIAHGPPKSHHMVVFYRAELPRGVLSAELDLHLQMEEVSAAAWLDQSTVRALIEGIICDTQQPLTIDAITAERTRVVYDMHKEKFALGHLYALYQWCEMEGSFYQHERFTQK
jgi:8-oxo-dGTP pyrophosphatase MutT (NUDIX family)